MPRTETFDTPSDDSPHSAPTADVAFTFAVPTRHVSAYAFYERARTTVGAARIVWCKGEGPDKLGPVVALTFAFRL